MLYFGTRVLTICPLPGGRLVAHGQSVYPCHEDGIQFGPYLTTALDEVGCDVSLSWVGLGAVDIVSTALGIIQYWEGTPLRVLISVLLIQNIPRKKNQ